MGGRARKGPGVGGVLRGEGPVSLDVGFERGGTGGEEADCHELDVFIG